MTILFCGIRHTCVKTELYCALPIFPTGSPGIRGLCHSVIIPSRQYAYGAISNTYWKRDTSPQNWNSSFASNIQEMLRMLPAAANAIMLES